MSLFGSLFKQGSADQEKNTGRYLGKERFKKLNNVDVRALKKEALHKLKSYEARRFNEVVEELKPEVGKYVRVGEIDELIGEKYGQRFQRGVRRDIFTKQPDKGAIEASRARNLAYARMERLRQEDRDRSTFGHPTDYHHVETDLTNHAHVSALDRASQAAGTDSQPVNPPHHNSIPLNHGL